jgi:hypothetical protein
MIWNRLLTLPSRKLGHVSPVMRQPVDKLRSSSFRALSRPRSASLLGKILIKSWYRDGMRSCVDSGTAFSTVADALTCHRVRLTHGPRERRKVGPPRAVNPFNSDLISIAPGSLCPATRRRIAFDHHSSRKSSVARSRFTSDDANTDVTTVAIRTDPTTTLNELSGTEYGGSRTNRGRSTLMK